MGRIRIIWLIGLLLCLGGCSNHGIRKQLEGFLSQEVRFPSTMTCYSGSAQGIKPLSDSIPKLVIYVDSTQCSTCRIGHLPEYIPLQEESIQTGRFMLAIILSPPVNDFGNIAHLLETYQYPFPVYLDKEHSFRKENGFIPDDSRFHAFLTDRFHRPVFVGDPVRSDRLRQLFEQALQNL